MKEFINHEASLGGEGAKFGVKVGVEEEFIKLDASVSYPIAKVVEPVMGVVDTLVDKLEKLIPGDQTAMAAQAKIDARAAIVKALSEQV